ncbi:MAG: vWA domain-containing protein [Ferruginibacter sp.]
MFFNYLQHIQFAYPMVLGLLFVIPLLAIWYWRSHNKTGVSLKVTSISAFKGMHSWKTGLRHFPFILRLIGLVFIILAMARPQVKNVEQQAEGEGVDIILAIDVSGSMTAQDFVPNRLEAAKKVALDFMDKRLTDRIGVVIFAGESFTQCPLTTDKNVLKSAIESIRNGLIVDGTAIGDGLSTSVDRLRASKSKSKVVILLTDGENNGGLIGPANAKEIAKAFGVKVYTIGVGTDGYAPFPVQTELGVIIQQQKVTIDEKLLNIIATETGGKYFRAKDNAGLENIYTAIDGLEKSKVDISTLTRYSERFVVFLIVALLILCIEFLLRFTVFKKFP